MELGDEEDLVGGGRRGKSRGRRSAAKNRSRRRPTAKRTSTPSPRVEGKWEKGGCQHIEPRRVGGGGFAILETRIKLIPVEGEEEAGELFYNRERKTPSSARGAGRPIGGEGRGKKSGGISTGSPKHGHTEKRIFTVLTSP